MKKSLIPFFLLLGLAVFAWESAPDASEDVKSPAASDAGKPAAVSVKNAAAASEKSKTAEAKPASAEAKPASEKPSVIVSEKSSAAEAKPASEKPRTAEAKPASVSEIAKKEAAQTEAFVRALMSKLPVGTLLGPVDYSGKTWIMNGFYPKPFKQIRDELAEAMRAQGYQLMHEIPLTKEEDRVLVAWKKDDVKVIFMLWKRTEKETGFSMGKTK